MSVRVRFAPSPTGIPHIGNTRTALFNYLFTRHHKGKFILRIEDTDRSRLVPGSLEKILEILKTVGIEWDEGPYIQSERLKIYQDYANQLVKAGVAYRCYCSSKRLEKMRLDQQANHQLPKYDRHCLGLPKKSGQYVIRLKAPQTGVTSWNDLIQGKIEFKNELIDDQVLLKSDGYPTYHLAVVVDDHLMNISHILRAAEWISSTPKHILLYRAFNWPLPKIGHFPVILGPDKAKLSKRHGAKSLLDYLAEGYLVEALVSFMVYLGWSYQDNSQILSLDQLIKLFDLDKVHQANPIFDIKKLDYFNAKAIRQLSPQKLLKLIKPFLILDLSDQQLLQIIPLIQERMIKLTDINDFASYYAGDIKLESTALINQSQHSVTVTKKIFNQIITAYKNCDSWTVKDLEVCGHNLLTKTDWSPRELFMLMRLSLTGKTATPPLFEIMTVLGKAAVLQRLAYAEKIL